jgi:hypothetical protein
VSACNELQVSIPSDEAAREAALADLSVALARLPPAGYAEVWVDHDPFPALCALLNGDQGWLMYVRYEGDAGFSSRNRAYSGPPTAEIEYMLGNGQVDHYPASWAYPRSQLIDTLHSFARTRRVGGVSWFNDSGDGATSPTDDARSER